MVDKNQIIEQIIEELNFRSREGYPLLKKSSHIELLSEILTELGLSSIKHELIENLLIEDEEEPLDAREKERAKKMGLVWKGKGYGKEEDDFISYKNDGGKLVKVDKDGESEPEETKTAFSGEAGDEFKSQLPKEDPAYKPSKKAKEGSYESISTNASQKVKELYGEDGKGELLQKSKTSDDALKNGYVKGANWVAPGNAGSNFNENMSNEGALILEKYPDLSEDELVDIIFKKTRGSKLGGQQKKTTIEGSDKGNVPKDIPTSDRDLYRNCIITARSARSKYSRAKKAKEAASSQVGFGTQTNTMAFGGTSSDLDNLSNEINSANKVFIHDAGTDKVYEIPKDVMKEWVASSGGGENASDTAVLTKDENGNIIYDGWSDKKGLSDIQGNSTLNDDFSKADKTVDELVSSGKVDSEIASQAKSIINNAQSESNDIEQGYKNAVYKEGQYLSTYEESKKDKLASILEQQDKGYEEAGTKNHVQNLMKKTDSKTHREALDKLLEGRDIQWEWVKGHSGDKYNDIADKLAVDAITSLKKNNSKELSHLDSEGKIKMVDVSGKGITSRTAVVSGKVVMKKETLEIIKKGELKKGDIFTLSRTAGITAVKSTPTLIPLCHTIPLSEIKIEIDVDEELPGLVVKCTTKADWKTGVEIEAFTGVSITCVTIYDMCKAVDKSAYITDVKLLEKYGGASGDYSR